MEFHSCLDPSSGIGAFAGTFAPYARRIDALEKDLLTARIAQALHPLGESKVTVHQAPFESLGELAETDRYDLITSNIPFGDFMVYDRAYSKGKIASSGKQHAPSIITSSSRGWIAYERVASWRSSRRRDYLIPRTTRSSDAI